jgi:hypothetical protein
LEEPGINERIILSWILRKWDGMAWIDVAQDRDRWRELGNTAVTLQVFIKCVEFLD